MASLRFGLKFALPIRPADTKGFVCAWVSELLCLSSQNRLACIFFELVLLADLIGFSQAALAQQVKLCNLPSKSMS